MQAAKAIGFLLPSLSRAGGGITSSALRLAQNVGEKTSVQIFGLEDQFTRDDLAAWSPLSTCVFRVRGPRGFGYAAELKSALKKSSIGLLHTHGLWMYPSIAALNSSRPYLISPHGMLDAWALQHSRWKKKIAAYFFENAHLGGAACLHALCEAEAKSIRDYGLRNPICVIPNGVDSPKILEDGEALWPVEEGRKWLLYLGRLHPKKGLANLLKAWHQTTGGGADWHLVIAGWDQNGHETELKSLTDDLGLKAKVHFPGPLFGAEKAAAYRQADAFILPSLSEGLPMVLLEAWANGLPVLMTPECNLPEGFAADAAIRIGTEPTEITAGLGELFLKSDSERRAIGSRGRELVEKKFAWPEISQEMLAVYRWVLDGGEKPKSIFD